MASEKTVRAKLRKLWDYLSVNKCVYYYFWKPTRDKDKVSKNANSLYLKYFPNKVQGNDFNWINFGYQRILLSFLPEMRKQPHWQKYSSLKVTNMR